MAKKRHSRPTRQKKRNSPSLPQQEKQAVQVAQGGGHRLRSSTIGALPILDHLLQRMDLENLLAAHLPREDQRSKLPVAKGLLVLVKNLLVSREPLYGLGEWAARYDPKELGLSLEQLLVLNDDRLGRCLSIFFHSDWPGLVLDLMRHVLREFALGLDELHNDSTSVSFFGAYGEAAEEGQRRGRRTLAITYGYSKDHRPDLKQLLYILTITNDGGVPVHFRPASGNVTDEHTHRENWELLCQIAGRSDFLYVADCKLATLENMNYIAGQGGRFVSVLPRTRKEDARFRHDAQVGDVLWQPLWDKTDEQGDLVDRFSVCREAEVLPEGYPVWWYHSTRKAELDLATRSRHIERAEQRLRQLQEQLSSPRSRQRDRGKVQDLVAKILREEDVEAWIHAEVHVRQEETYHQQKRGRPGKDTIYVKEVSTRVGVDYTIDAEQLQRERKTDGTFPLVTNDQQLGPLEILHAYKRQPQVEKRFEQLKTEFAVAPVFLKDVGRIEALFCVYFLVLLTEALLERELRKAMERERVESLPMYPEGRSCRRPTSRRLIDLFEPLQRHTLEDAAGHPIILASDLSPLHRQLLHLLQVPAGRYDV